MKKSIIRGMGQVSLLSRVSSIRRLETTTILPISFCLHRHDAVDPWTASHARLHCNESI